MSLKIEQRNLTFITHGVIAHGVNCQHAMGAGVAKDLYEEWPEVRETYMAMPKNQMKLGLVQPVRINQDLVIMNCFTQEYYGREKGRRYADPEAIQTCLNKVLLWMEHRNLYQLYMPFIGCSLGGLDWEKDVHPIIKDLSLHYYGVDITVCSKPLIH